jgi:hypothetical protein
MNRLLICVAAAGLGLSAFAVPSAQAELLANPGFEQPITTDGAPFVGSWEGFSGTGGLAANSNNSPRSGNAHLLLSITNTDNTFAGVFQDVPGLAPGSPVTFSGYHRTPSNPLDLGVEVRIEWRNSVTNAEISRTPNSTTVPTASYTPFSLSATVPAGADTARVVYAIQSFGPEPTNNGVVFVDDVSFVPEPSAGVLVGFGVCLAGMRRRRRRAA